MYFFSAYHRNMKYQESDHYELKSELTDGVKKEIIAFLNGDGGTIAIGVNKDHTIVARTDEENDADSSKISNWVHDAVIYPSIEDLIRIETNPDGVLLIIVKQGAEKPYYLSDKGPTPAGTFVRMGRSRNPASPELIRRMMRDSYIVRYEDVTSANQGLTFKVLSEKVADEGIDIGEDKFEANRLKSSSGSYTNLALLLSDQNPFISKFGVYEGKDGDVFKAKKEFSGSILKQIDDAGDYFDLVKPMKPIFGDGLQRREQEGIPDVAFREAMLNAFSHADYSIDSPIILKMRSDRLEISSPGGLFNGLSLEKAKLGKTSERNPGLSKILKQLCYVEGFSHGLPTILGVYKQYGVEPIFDVDYFSFEITLPNLISSNAKPIGEEASGLRSDNKQEQAILRLLKEKGEQDRESVQKELGVGATRARNILRIMVVKGLIKKNGKTKAASYSLNISSPN
jgi:ATP-dependent DNA helicase RecG